MPSPFPGMDPYLEGSLWTTIHHTLITEIVRQLAPRLRPGYIALPQQRLVTDDWDPTEGRPSEFYPDVAVKGPGFIAEPRSPWPADAGAGLTIRAPLLMETVLPPQIPHASIEICDTAGRRLVTAIEMLSPTNKRGSGRQLYLAKRQRILRSDVHLLEIDLLRKGRRVPMRDELPAASYFIFLCRADQALMTEVWPIALDEPLPTVPVPLLPGDADVALELQNAFTSAYDLIGYDREIDYTEPPEIAWTPEEAAWARGWVDKNSENAGTLPHA